MRRQPLVATCVAAALATGCASAPRVPVQGRQVTVVPEGDGPRRGGELLVVGPERLWVHDGDDVAEIRLPEVREVRVRRHRFGARAALTWALVGGLVTGGALAGACASVEGSGNCGRVGLVAAGLWLLTGAVAAPLMESSSRIDLWKPTPDQLRPFARLPQGLPEGLKPEDLAPADDDSSGP